MAITRINLAGDGSNLTNLNASQLSSGTVPDARFPATLPSANGTNLTSLNATEITTGTIANARLPSDITVANDLTVQGDLVVNGNTTTIAASELKVEDSLIQLASNNEVSDSVDIGFVGHYNDGSTQVHTGFFRDADNGQYYLFKGYDDATFDTDTPPATIDRTANTFALADLNVGAFTSNGIDDNATSTAVTIDSSQNVSLSGDFTVDTNTLYVNSTTNRVGIGESAPTTTLEVNGTSRVTDGTTNIDTVSAANVGYFGTQTAHDLSLRTNDVVRMTIDSSGDVGIGVTPGTLEGVNINNTYNLGFKEGAGDAVANIFRQTSSGALILAQGYKRSATASGFASSQGGEFTRAAISVTDGIKFYVTAAVNVAAGTDHTPTERMRIDSSGNVGIGQTAPDTSASYTTLHIGDNAASPQNARLILEGSTNKFGIFAFQDYFGVYDYTNSLERLRIDNSGDLHADQDVIAFSTTLSDARLKDSIKTIDSALDKVNNLRGVTYTWNAGSREGKRDLGVIAQEVEQVIPEIVREKEMPLLDGGTYKTVDYEKLSAVLIEAVKELKAEVDALKAAQ